MMSLVSHGSSYHLSIAIALTAVIPLLSISFVAATFLWPNRMFSHSTQICVSVFGLVVGITGYCMLRRYPQNIVALRDYLRRIAEGELPERIDLIRVEDDVNAIQRYMNVILEEMHERVKLLEKQLALSKKMHEIIATQNHEILEAERQRVMIESLGSACHHLGQPLTVLGLYLESLKSAAKEADSREKFEKCYEAFDRIAVILEKLRHVSQYRTVPYQTFHEVFESAPDDRILDIEQTSLPL